jgi:hypothetical protein
MAEIARFPPLPPLPEPVSLPVDTRQVTFDRIAGCLTEQMNEGAGVAATNTARGHYASAVDLGALQEILAKAIERLDMTEVRDRWSDDLFAWFRKSLLSCVQRCKEINFDLAERGVRITLETQDDHGYYRYEFDVFPGK